jgi:protein-disulfide isomerase
MQSRFPKNCRLAVFAALAFVLGFATVAAAQSRPPITAEVQMRILGEPGAPLLGSAAANVTVVEYFDYNCPFCKELAPAFHPFIEKDGAAAVLYKEWPIFGGVSVYAAQAALAANYQGKYLQAHDALISGPRLTENRQVDAALKGAGIDMTQLEKDLATHKSAIDGLLRRNDAEARSLGLRGTPGVLVGRRIGAGISNLETLQSAVAASRRAAVR